MVDQEKIMRRKHQALAFKLTAAGFIILMLIRTDWLASVFINSSQSNGSKRKSLISADLMHDDAKFHENQHRKSIIRAMIHKEDTLACSIPQLKNRIQAEGMNEADCKRIKPFESSCRLAEELFGDPSALDISGACKTPKSKEFCNITGSPGKWTVNCEISLCENTLQLGTTKENGKIEWKIQKSATDIAQAIEQLISKSRTRYCLISCFEDANKFPNNDDSENPNVTGEPQILNLPPRPSQPRMKFNNGNKKIINFNFVFIDSVSRHHFYRSLPRTVKALDSMAAKYRDRNTMVLDFELVQGIRLRTFENLQALFSGYVNPFDIPFGTQDMPSEKLHLEQLLVPLRSLGFTNLWLEDLCPFWEWGLSKDLLVYQKDLGRNEIYRKFTEACKQAGIDDLGNTFSSCDILKANKVADPFHAPNKICYNGKHQHEYMISYLKTFQKTMQHRNQPFLSFLETNIGHIGSGKRIQFFDEELADYLHEAEAMTDTLTIVFSDHGNAYGNYINKVKDGKVEIYHPALFMIIPERVQSFFTDRQLHALKVNQNRLISILDLHYTVSYIIELLHTQLESKTIFESKVSDFNQQFNVSTYGLLSEISPSRTCSHMPRVMPNLCICEGYDVTSNNRAYHYILAIYFVGMINNQVQRQRLDQNGDRNGSKKLLGGFGNCQRLKVKKIRNVQNSKHNGHMSTAKMDLYVETDGQAIDEIFFISIQMKENSKVSPGSFERITPYSKYSNCCDKGVDVKLCVCKEWNDDILVETDIDDILENLLYSDLKNNITFMSINDQECLYILAQSNKAGVVYEAVNVCKMSLRLKLSFKPMNLAFSTANRIDIDMHHCDITFLAAGVSDEDNKWSCDFSVDVKVIAT